MHVRSCCFANLNLFLFYCFRCVAVVVSDQLQKGLFTILSQLKIEYPCQRDRPCAKSLVKPGLTSYQVFTNVQNWENQALTRAQLFKGRLGLNLGLN